jgi:integrase/recombinase XerC
VKKQVFPCLRIADWPELDRDLWRSAREPAGLFDDEAGFAAAWKPATIRGAEKGYGTWLAWLDGTGELHHAQHPCERVSKDRIKAFLSAYSVGRAELTVAGALRGLAYVLRACTPPHGVAWLTKLAHRMTNKAKPSWPKLPRLARVADVVLLSDRLMALGLENLDRGGRSGAPIYRDALIIGLLISRPWRRRNLADLRYGHTVFVDEHGIRVEIRSEHTKKGVAFSGYMPKRLEPAILTCLDRVRPVLLGNAKDDGWFWLGRLGRRMPASDITNRVTLTTRKHLGRDLSPHLFRDCAATEVALETPTQIGITRRSTMWPP